MSEKFPYSVEGLQEGLLPIQWVKDAIVSIGGKPGQRFALLSLKAHLEQALFDAGRAAIVKITGETLEILPPDRGDRHMEREGARAVRYFIGTHQRRLSRVDAGRLTQEQRDQRDRSLALNAMRISAIGGCKLVDKTNGPKLV